jgi:hypothetical protein
MADTIRLVDYFYIQVPDRPGEGAKVLAKLKEAGVDLRLYMGFPEARRAQLDLVPVDAKAFKAVAKANGWKVKGPKKALLVQGEDRVGAAAEILRKLAGAKVNVTADAAISAGDRYGMILWVKPKDVKKAARALGVR